ncbi:MAG: toprim domain-containing protein [Pseudomonadota bacterium]|jgi:phage/plasmid primase-like uncharacterized protein|nr:toprim domain-containing protein [Pseudomonadota bacterium]
MTTKRAPCPICAKGPRDRALSITTDERGTVSHCFRCGYVKAENLERLPLEPIRTEPKSTEPLEWSDKAEAIWRRTQPLRGTLGQTYLEHRGCVLPPADSDLRFLPASDKHPPTLCARVTDAQTNKPLTLHFTRLAADGRGKAGTEQDKLLLAGHRKKSGIIRLWPDECVTYGLGIAEGIETALVVARVFTPIWATVDAGNMAAFPALPGIDCLAVYADHDQAGMRAAIQCAQRWNKAVREVAVYRSPIAGEDAADVLERLAARKGAA